jgi:hypothetical protein
MDDHTRHAHALMDAIKVIPEVRTWRKEQVAKIAELQQGTWRERKDTDGKPVPKPPLGGPGCWFEYVVTDAGVSTKISVRCTETSEVIYLESGPA